MRKASPHPHSATARVGSHLCTVTQRGTGSSSQGKQEMTAKQSPLAEDTLPFKPWDYPPHCPHGFTLLCKGPRERQFPKTQLLRLQVTRGSNDGTPIPSSSRLLPSCRAAWLRVLSPLPQTAYTCIGPPASPCTRLCIGPPAPLLHKLKN